MAEYLIRRLRYDDYATIKEMKFRDEDIREVSCVLNVDAVAERIAGYIADDCMCFPHTFLCLSDGEPFAIVGTVATQHQSVRTIWCVGTDKIANGGMELLLWSQTIVNMMHEMSPILENYVDSRNRIHVKWIKSMGFTFTGRDYFIDGIKFLHFARVDGVSH